MTGFLVVLQRELRDLWLLLPASLIAGLACALWPAIRGAADPSNERFVVSTTIGVGAAFALAAVLGSIALGRDLFEGRLGFYFERPVAASAIWAGKMGAVPVLSTTVALLIFLPSCFDGRVLDEQARQILHSSILPFLFLGSLGIAAVSHLFAVWFRSRSLWLLFDLPAVAVFVLLAWRIFAPEVELQSATQPQKAIGFLVVTAASLAGLAQISIGRTDLDRGRRTLSLVLWSVLLGGTIFLSGMHG